MKASEVAFPSLSPLYPIPKPCYTNCATSRLRNLPSFLISDISSLISLPFFTGTADLDLPHRPTLAEDCNPFLLVHSHPWRASPCWVMLAILRAEMTDMASAQ